MSRRAVFARRADPGRTEQPAESLATEREAFLFGEFLTEMVIVEPGIGGASQA
jgi:hypothetical protein